MATRAQFGSRFGFVMAAAGSAVGLGNIWGFPTQVAENGGAAFVLVYIVLAFLLAYPVLMAELVIGRHAKSNMVSALGGIATTPAVKTVGRLVGLWGLAVASLILSFYAIVAGWMLAFGLQAIAQLLGLQQHADWLVTFSLPRNIIFTSVFVFLTAMIIYRGVGAGIERWSSRLMPILLLLLVLLIAYVATLAGASEGWLAYTRPEFSQVLKPELILSAMGQAFFSLSLGVGTMLVYGSYISKKENLVSLGAAVAGVDIGIAILAGMLIIPAMYVALHNGVEIYTAEGSLIAGDQLVFTVIPALFDTMGSSGTVVSILFFSLMSIAALTSSISMLEVPVAYVSEDLGQSRGRATVVVAAIILCISIVIALNFELLFGQVISLTTEYSQPLLGMMICIYAGWVWARGEKLREFQEGNPGVENGFFWRFWPGYIKYVCPLIVFAVFLSSLIG